MRVAAIDIGTNTVLLLVADIDADGRIEHLLDLQETPRLGRHLDASGRILPAGIDALCDILRDYVRRAREAGAGSIAACATSAARTAANRADLLEAVRRSPGIEIEVIDGDLEAQLTWEGVLGGGGVPAGEVAVVDVGGGSTELSWSPPGAGNGKRTPLRTSLEIGSVRITERHLRGAPPLPGEVEAARARVVEELAPVRNPGFDRYALVAVAGTATTVAAIRLGLAHFDREAIDGCSISRADLRAVTARLLGLDPAGVGALTPLAAGREDILAGGALILSTIADHFRFREVRISTRGLRHGIALREWRRLRGRESGGPPAA